MVRARAKGYGEDAPGRSVRVNPLPRWRSSADPPEPTRPGRPRAFGPLSRPPITAVIGPPEERLAPEHHLPRADQTEGDANDGNRPAPRPPRTPRRPDPRQ